MRGLDQTESAFTHRFYFSLKRRINRGYIIIKERYEKLKF